MAVYVFDQGGQCLEINRNDPDPGDAAFVANHGSDAIILRPAEDPFPTYGREQVALAEGAIVAQPAAEVWLHLGISGGDGETPPGIPADGSTALTITTALKLGQAADAADIPSSPEVAGTWRVTVRDQDARAWDVIPVMVDGQGKGTFAVVAPAGKTGRCHIAEGDLTPVTVGGVAYKVRLADPVAPFPGHFVAFRAA